MSFSITCLRAVRHRFLVLIALIVIVEPALGACSISSSNLNFGDYDVFATTHSDFTGNIDVTCDTSTSYTILLGAGNGTISDRYMLNATKDLHYNLYVDASRTVIWGDGVGGGSTQSGLTASSKSHTVYGRIPARQNVEVGSYQDSVIVTLQY